MNVHWDGQTESKRSGGSSGTKIVAALLVVMILLGSGIILLLDRDLLSPSVDYPVRVAVIDSGINSDITNRERIVSERSFVDPNYGYDITDLSTSDSEPEGVPHGTLVTRALLSESRNAVIINAKIMGEDGIATVRGIEEAIYWAIDQNASVINLSLGSGPSYGDPLSRALEYAFYKGVVVVAAAGNEGEGGIAGNSISSPSVYQYCLAVAALDQDGEPADYSSRGPTADRTMKPDIAARGYIQTADFVYFGTSFASPIVAGAAAELIAYLEFHSIPYTPGLIFSILLTSAAPMVHADYVVGAGRLDSAAAQTLLKSFPMNGLLPRISYVFPGALPIDFEHVFTGDEYSFNVQVLTSGLETFNISVVSEDADIFNYPLEIEVNQSSLIEIGFTVPFDSPGDYQGTFFFNAGNGNNVTLDVSFNAADPIARIAFDIAHSTWNIDTTYGQFKELYKLLIENEISVTELRETSQITYSSLTRFDGIMILDPCTWTVNRTDPDNPTIFSIGFSESEIQAYQDYFEDGGGIFVASLSNASIDVDSLNEFLAWTGFSSEYARYPLGGDPVLVTEIIPHIITSGIPHFNFFGTFIEVPAQETVLARVTGKPVLVCYEGSGGGRFVFAGTNFFIDNWGILGEYSSNYNGALSEKIALWILNII